MATKNPKTPRVTKKTKKVAKMYADNPTWAKEDAKGPIPGYKKGGVTKMKTGGTKKPLVKAQKGVNTAGQAYMKYVPGATASDTLGTDDTRFRNAGFAENTSNWNAKNKMLDMTYGEDIPAGNERATQSPKTVSDYARNLKAQFKQKKGGFTKKAYKTGGMVNANSKITASKSATGKVGGVTKAVSKVAVKATSPKGTVGGTSKAPKKASPIKLAKAKMGGMKSKSC